MISKIRFPNLNGLEDTKATLHAYSKVIGAIPRAYAVFHPKWWHISLKVQPTGLVTENMRLPNGGIFNLKMDLSNHVITLTTSQGMQWNWSMAIHLTANQLAEQIFEQVAELGLETTYARSKFENDDPREYRPAHAKKYLALLVQVEQLFRQHQHQLQGHVGPIQLWPHGFDLAFEWFGTRRVEHEEGGVMVQSPAQLNLGFSPGEPNHPAPYFYSNPWPFEKEKLLSNALPSGAIWFTESWSGSILEYQPLVGAEDADQQLLAYAKAVFESSAPTLSE